MVLGFRSALCRFHRLQEAFSYPSQGFLLISRGKDPQKSRTQKNFIKLYHYGLISRRLSTNLTSKCCVLEEKNKQLAKLLYCQCLGKQVTFGKIFVATVEEFPIFIIQSKAIMNTPKICHAWCGADTSCYLATILGTKTAGSIIIRRLNVTCSLDRARKSCCGFWNRFYNHILVFISMCEILLFLWQNAC